MVWHTLDETMEIPPIFIRGKVHTDDSSSEPGSNSGKPMPLWRPSGREPPHLEGSSQPAHMIHCPPTGNVSSVSSVSTRAGLLQSGAFCNPEYQVHRLPPSLNRPGVRAHTMRCLRLWHQALQKDGSHVTGRGYCSGRAGCGRWG